MSTTPDYAGLLGWLEFFSQGDEKSPHARAAQAIRTLLESNAALERERDGANDVIARIWRQLGNPSYEELAGRSIYDLIDELKERAEAEANAEGGEPVAWQYRYRPIGTVEWSEWADGRKPDFRGADYEAQERPLYTHPAPQPSGPVGALSLARSVLAQIISAGNNMPGPTSEDIDKAFWAVDAALTAGKPEQAVPSEPVAHAYVIDGECEQIEWGTEIGLPDDPSLVLLYAAPTAGGGDAR